MPKGRAMDYPLAFKALNTIVVDARRKLDLPNEYRPMFFFNLSYNDEYLKVSESLFSLLFQTCLTPLPPAGLRGPREVSQKERVQSVLRSQVRRTR